MQFRPLTSGRRVTITGTHRTARANIIRRLCKAHSWLKFVILLANPKRFTVKRTNRNLSRAHKTYSSSLQAPVITAKNYRQKALHHSGASWVQRHPKQQK